MIQRISLDRGEKCGLELREKFSISFKHYDFVVCLWLREYPQLRIRKYLRVGSVGLYITVLSSTTGRRCPLRRHGSWLLTISDKKGDGDA